MQISSDSKKEKKRSYLNRFFFVEKMREHEFMFSHYKLDASLWNDMDNVFRTNDIYQYKQSFSINW